MAKKSPKKIYLPFKNGVQSNQGRALENFCLFSEESKVWECEK